MTDLLRPFRTPSRLAEKAPTQMFNYGLTDWETLRGHEIEASTPPHYEYYAGMFSSNARDAWRAHDEATAAENGAGGWTFDDYGMRPEQVLGVIARSMGWRLVPLARWAARSVRSPEISHQVETLCRQWCASADSIYRLLSTRPRTQTNVNAAQLILKPLRDEAREIERAVMYELRLYFRV